MGSHLTKYFLDDVIEKFIDYRGKTPKKTLEGIPLITAKIIKKGRIEPANEFIAFENYETWMTRGFPEIGDVILTTEAPLGEIAQIKSSKKIALAQRIITLRGKIGILDNTYLLFCLQSSIMQNRLKARASGSTVEGIKSSELKKIEIDLPPLKEQQAIAEILSSLDDKIELNLQMNNTLEEMAMTLYKEWFVDFGPQELIKISELVNLNPKLQLSKGKMASYVEMKSLPVDLMSVSEAVEKEFNGGSKFQNGDTLLARITPCLENGKTAFVDFLKEEEIAFGSTEFIVMRAKESVSKFWVYCLARDVNFRKHAISTMVGSSGRQRVQEGPLMNYEINGFSKELMRKFEETVETWFSLIRSNTIESLSLTQTRDTLLPKLISGEVRVKDIEKEIAEVL